MLILLGKNDDIAEYIKTHFSDIDEGNDVVYYPSVTAHISEFGDYIQKAVEENPPIIVTQSLELLDLFLQSDLNFDVITVRRYDSKIVSAIRDKSYAKHLRDQFDMDLRW